MFEFENEDFNYINNLKLKQKSSILNLFLILGILIFLVLGIIAFIFDKTSCLILVLIGIVLLILSLLVRKNSNVKTISIILIISAYILIIPYFGIFVFNRKNYSIYEWNKMLLSTIIEKPSSNYGIIVSNTNEYLSISVNQISRVQFEEYIESCKNKGFLFDIEESSRSFKANNQYGYELIVKYNQFTDEMEVKLRIPILNWQDGNLNKVVPIPKSKYGKIEKNDDASFVAYVGATSKEEYYNYVVLCSNEGFNINIKNSLTQFSASNKESRKLLLEYLENQIMKITIYEVEYNVDINVEYIQHSVLKKDDIRIYVDESDLGIINCGKNENYNLNLVKGNHKIKFVNTNDENIIREEIINVSKIDKFMYKIISTINGIEIDTTSPLVKEIRVISPTSGEYEKGQNIKIRVYFNEFIKGTAPILRLKIGNNSVIATSSNPDGMYDYIDYSYIVGSEYGKVDIESYTGGNLTDITGNIAKINTLPNTGYQISIKVPEANRASISQKKFVASNKRTIEYWMYVPDISIVGTYENIPLVVALHMYGIKSMKTLSSYSIMGYINNKSIQPNAIVITPLAYNNSNQINEYDTASIIELINDISKSYNINKNKISIAGHSMGARNALRIAKANPNYFSACVLFSWVESGAEGARHDMQTKPMPTCKTRFVYEDRKSADFNRNIAINLSKNYPNISVINIPNSTHDDVVKAYITADIMKWMIEQTK